MIPTIGIVGGIGSGKSLVADALARHGGHLIAADAFGHDALREPDIRTQLIARWGEGILNDRGDVDRRQVGHIVFADETELRFLEALVFPFIEKRILQEIARARSDSEVKFTILDAAILLETGWHRHCDKIIFVDAPRPLRLARVQEKRGWDEAELTRREARQMPLDEKKRRANLVIVNDALPEKVAPEVQDALERWNLI